MPLTRISNRAAPVAALLTRSVLLAALASSSALAQDPADTPAAPSATAGAASGLMNPDISLDGLFSLAQFSRTDPVVFQGGHDPRQSGFNLQQVELSLSSNVDPYFRADAFLVLTGEGTIEVEEAAATTLSLPFGLQARAGQMFTAFGRHNPTHPHAWGWADKPLVLGRFFGGDGLRNPGAQLSWLSPLPWFSEVVGSVQNSNGETAPSFLADQKMRSLGDALYLARWNNFFEVTDSVSLNVGASYLSGRNPTGEHTQVLGGDLYLRIRAPEGLSYLSIEFEALQRRYGTPEGRLDDWGWFLQTEYRLPGSWARWHVGLRLDQVGDKAAPVVTSRVGDVESGEDADVSRRYRVSPVVTFYPSEFSKLRFQYDYDRPEALESAQHAGIVQLEFTMGAHGAHKF